MRSRQCPEGWLEMFAHSTGLPSLSLDFSLGFEFEIMLNGLPRSRVPGRQQRPVSKSHIELLDIMVLRE